MKKKHRDIVVDGVTYGWIPGDGCCTIFKDKKSIIYFEIDEDIPIIPSIVASHIQKWVKENK